MSRAPASGLRVLAIANQKGGVGKTTTAINLGTALAAIGEKVLILDLDPQGNASTGVGIGEDARPVTSFDVLAGKSSIAKAATKTLVPNLSIVPANADLVGLESELMTAGQPPLPAARCRGRADRRAEGAAGRGALHLPADRLPAVAQSAHAQCHGGGARGAGAGAVRVLRAGRHLAAQADHRSDQGDAEPGARDPGRGAHHARLRAPPSPRRSRPRCGPSSGPRSTRP